MRALRRTAALAGVLGLTALVATASPASAATNDPLRSKQWGLTQVRAEQAWPTSRGAGATIAVVDTGVDLSHPDLAAKLVPGATFVGCAGGATVCSDGNWKGVDGVGQDVDSHGTHVSGIAAAITDNGTGVAGVAPDASIMPIKVLEDGSGSTDDIALGIRWAADHGADVINLSLGSLPGTQVLSIIGLDTAVEEAIAYARTKGAVVGDRRRQHLHHRLHQPRLLEQRALRRRPPTGTSCTRRSRSCRSSRTSRSSRRPAASPSAPATTTCGPPSRPGSRVAAGVAGYDSFAGTSMATPHVAGVAALLLAQGRTVDQTEQALLDTARTPGARTRGHVHPALRLRHRRRPGRGRVRSLTHCTQVCRDASPASRHTCVLVRGGQPPAIWRSAARCLAYAVRPPRVSESHVRGRLPT